MDDKKTRSRASFVRLAEARTNKVLHSLAILGNLSNRSNYTYAGEDVERIFKALAQQMKETEARFRVNLPAKKTGGFKLDE